MGLSASKRVKTSLSNSSSFGSACDSAFANCLSLTQHAFPGVLPYQLPTAAAHLHHSLSDHPLILRWVPTIPTRTQIDSALRVVTRTSQQSELVLGIDQFKDWALELFAAAALENAGRALLRRLPFGIAGIAGVGMVTRSGKKVVGSAIALYALGVATSIYLSLAG